MITTADMIMDIHGRPILVLPRHISDGKAVLTVMDDSFAITVDGKREVLLEKIEAGILMALGLQKKIGISIHDGGHLLPDTIDYVADVELRFNAIAK